MRNEYDFSKGKRGAVIEAPEKEQVTILLDEDVIAYYRSKAKIEGVGYQHMMNATLRNAMSPEAARQSKESSNSLKLTKSFRENWSV